MYDLLGIMVAVCFVILVICGLGLATPVLVGGLAVCYVLDQ